MKIDDLRGSDRRWAEAETEAIKPVAAGAVDAKETANALRIEADAKMALAHQLRQQIAELTQQANALEKRAWSYRTAAEYLSPEGDE